MSVQQIAETIVADRGPILVTILIAMTLVQIVPIKLNPWDAIFRWLGRRLNKEVMEKVNTIETRLDAHIEISTEAELRARRASILDFSSSVIRGVNYHREKFDFMIAECDSYEKYCKENDIMNGVAEASIEEIRRVYKEHLQKNDFLTDAVSAKGSE